MNAAADTRAGHSRSPLSIKVKDHACGWSLTERENLLLRAHIFDSAVQTLQHFSSVLSNSDEIRRVRNGPRA